MFKIFNGLGSVSMVIEGIMFLVLSADRKQYASERKAVFLLN